MDSTVPTTDIHRGVLVLLSICLSLSLPGQLAAETERITTTGSAIEMIWTTCSATPAVVTDCTYTALYAAKSSQFQQFLTLSLSTLRVFPDGTVTIIESAAGYVQPPASLSIQRSTLGRAAVAGIVNLFGRCGDPNDFGTCYYYGAAEISANLRPIGGTTKWPASKSIEAPSGVTYTLRAKGASRPSQATGSATYNGGGWPLGSSISGRILRFQHIEELICPGRCDRAVARRGVPEMMALDDPSAAAGVRDLLAASTLPRQ